MSSMLKRRVTAPQASRGTLRGASSAGPNPSAARRRRRRRRAPSSEEIPHESRDERRPVGKRGHVDILAFAVRVLADRAETVEHGDAEGGKQVPVRAAADRRFAERRQPEVGRALLRTLEQLRRNPTLERSSARASLSCAGKGPDESAIRVERLGVNADELPPGSCRESH